MPASSVPIGSSPGTRRRTRGSPSAGPRRCIGAGFFLVESVEILRELLRAYEIEPVRSQPERLPPRGIINAPSHGGRIRMRARAS
jgi:cytochrome P450